MHAELLRRSALGTLSIYALNCKINLTRHMQDHKDEFSPTELDNFLNNMNITFYLALCVPLTLFIVVFIDSQEKGIAFVPTTSPTHYTIAILCVLIWFIGARRYHHVVKAARNLPTLKQKLISFRKAAIVKYIAGAGGCILAVAALYFTAGQAFLIALGVLLVLFSINRPTPYRILKDLKLDKEERKILREYRKHL